MGLTFRGSDKKLEEIVWRSLTIFSFKFSFSLIMIRHDIVKAVRGMNVQICTKASNLVYRYILTWWTQICREPKPIFNGVAILDDSKWPPSENTFFTFLANKQS